jgi:NAD+ synthase
LTTAQVELVWGDIAAKRKPTRYLHEPPLLVESAREVL